MLHDDALAAHPGDATGEPAERADRPHRLGKAWRVALDHLLRALWSLITRGEARAAGCDDQAGEALGQLGERGGHGVSTVRAHLMVDDVESGAGQLLDERSAAGVVS